MCFFLRDFFVIKRAYLWSIKHEAKAPINNFAPERLKDKVTNYKYFKSLVGTVGDRKAQHHDNCDGWTGRSKLHYASLHVPSNIS